MPLRARGQAQRRRGVRLAASFSRLRLTSVAGYVTVPNAVFSDGNRTLHFVQMLVEGAPTGCVTVGRGSRK